MALLVHDGPSITTVKHVLSLKIEQLKPLPASLYKCFYSCCWGIVAQAVNIVVIEV